MAFATTSILKPRRRGVTQATIAQAVGVSVGTVSRVLAADPKLRISEERRRAILDTERRLGGLRRPKKRQLTRIIVAPVNRRTSRQWLHQQFLESPLHSRFREVLEEAGFKLFFNFVDHDRMADEVRSLAAAGQICDGVMILGGICSEAMGQVLRQYRLPHISNDPQAMQYGINTLYVERTEGWRRAIARLKELGHRRIGFLGTRTTPTYAEYGSAMLTEGLSIDEALNVRFDHRIGTSDLDCQEAATAMQRWIMLENPATAMICQNDGIAMGAITAMRTKGWIPGQELSLVGFGNIEPQSSPDEPILTTLENPMHQHGQRLAELLLNQILHGQRQTIHERITGPLILRSSVGPVHSTL